MTARLPLRDVGFSSGELPRSPASCSCPFSENRKSSARTQGGCAAPSIARRTVRADASPDGPLWMIRQSDHIGDAFRRGELPGRISTEDVSVPDQPRRSRTNQPVTPAGGVRVRRRNGGWIRSFVDLFLLRPARPTRSRASLRRVEWPRRVVRASRRFSSTVASPIRARACTGYPMWSRLSGEPVNRTVRRDVTHPAQTTTAPGRGRSLAISPMFVLAMDLQPHGHSFGATKPFPSRPCHPQRWYRPDSALASGQGRPIVLHSVGKQPQAAMTATPWRT
ncbi:hypothetical protein SAMN05216188_1349 [Lentzea xinjiangensis]|uniref:Uncharacterized protein n=1 Tax=Lentzea xinjiangensis TaxID=402600 RepID=A0A1H9WI76_9PSEU|nr:hypothetical protein SAMN05216188_1349 [Lentzea xinjiangensis]